jgi:predicted CXXCH cytochrome family protein
VRPVPPAGHLALKASGTELCRGCHGPMVAGVLGKNRVHLPVLAGRGCLGCHAPHASTQDALLAAPQKTLCGSCHGDTIQRDVRAGSHHEPVKAGQCTACHDPHGGDQALLPKKADGVALCGTCHDWAQHSAHPIGPKVIDPRNPNLTLECLSCHRSHGTEFKKLMPSAKHSELCTACHEQYRR